MKKNSQSAKLKYKTIWENMNKPYHNTSTASNRLAVGACLLLTPVPFFPSSFYTFFFSSSFFLLFSLCFIFLISQQIDLSVVFRIIIRYMKCICALHWYIDKSEKALLDIRFNFDCLSVLLVLRCISLSWVNIESVANSAVVFCCAPKSASVWHYMSCTFVNCLHCWQNIFRMKK